MSQVFKRVVTLVLCVFMVSSTLLTTTVSAESSDLGASSTVETFLTDEVPANSGNSLRGATVSSPPETLPLNSFSGEDRAYNFNENWKFNLGDATNAFNPTYVDSAWRELSLPHDYSIEQDYNSSNEAESGYLPGGIGWYRKTFQLSPEWENKNIRIDFGGAYMDATVWINGHELGIHPYGYTPFSFDLTDYLNFDEPNVIAVRTDNKIPSSRWYSGSGIYRDVNLTITDPVHVGLYGNVITTPNIATEYSSGNVTVNIKTTVENKSLSAENITLHHTIVKKGSAASVAETTTAITAVGSEANAVVSAQLTVPNPELWGANSPNLYVVKTEILKDNVVCDVYESDFGFRWTEWNANTGFFLNGQPLKLKGVCMHHDQGSLGSAAYRRAQERQVEILLEMGTNAIRVTHNPASDDLIEICNEKGMLLIDEAFDTWLMPKNGNGNDYARWFETKIEVDNEVLFAEPDMTWAEHDVKAMVRRGQNAPSIILWSMGNEVLEGIGSSQNARYAAVLNQLVAWTQEVDTTRPTTTGENKLKANWSEAITMANNLTAAGGTVGLNYTMYGQLDSYHNNNPTWLMYAAETASSIKSRGVYKNREATDRLLLSYDDRAVGWGAVASDSWYTTITKDFVAGEFVWTGFDYLGEPTPSNGIGSGSVGTWPAPKSSYFGIIDTAGLPKDSFYFYQSQWNDDVNTLHMLPAWNENVISKDVNGKVKVVVYSDAAKVELFFKADGSTTSTSLGAKTFNTITTPAGYTYQMENGGATDHKGLYLTWQVPYADGTLYAKAYDGSGAEITNTEGRNSVVTTGAATNITLTADRTTIMADGNDLSYVTVDIRDASGNIVPDAENDLSFSVSGEGELLALDNGHQVDHTPYSAGHRKALAGQLIAIVRSTTKDGSFTLSAAGTGLTGDSVTVTTTPQETSGQSVPISYTTSKNYYVQKGSAPTLPDKVKINYSDGTMEEKSVVWDDSYLTNGSLDQLGTYVINGVVDDINLTISINLMVIDEIAAVLNFSAVIPAGGNPVLPSTRPAIIGDGTVLDVEFAVTWENFDPSLFDSAGTVEIDGTADVMGKSIDVKAFIRVADAEITIGSNVAPQYLTLKQNIPAASQSDTLTALTNKSTIISANNEGGANPSAWSNYQSAQEGETTPEITLDFATAQNIGEIKLYFFTDTYATELPDNVELFYTLDAATGTEWHEITSSEVVGTTLERVTPYTYTFAPISAEGFKIRLTKTGTGPNVSQKACVGMTEVELFTATGNIVTNSSDEITELIVNGVTLAQSVLDARLYETPALIAEISAVSEYNAAITILPPFENVISIITESENHLVRGIYRIQLDNPSTSEPGDDSLDYPREKTTATAGSVEDRAGNEGPIAHVVDNNPATYWHSKWAEDLAAQPDKRWAMLELDELIIIDGLRYLPRPTLANGIVTEYRIEVSTDNVNWTSVATGSWAHNTAWKSVKFAPVEAQYVKLYGVATKGGAGDAPDKFMSGAEIRVQQKDPTIEDISSATITLDNQSYFFTGAEIIPQPTVVFNGATLRYGLDYRLSYENNTEVGTATVKASGIIKYDGDVSTTFTIEAAPLPTIQSVLPVADVTVPNGTDFSAIQGLPQQVEVVLSDNAQQMIDVQWVAPSNYDGDTGETYVAVGNIPSSATVLNPSNLTATVNIVVQEAGARIHQITVDSPAHATVTVPSQATFDETVAFSVAITDSSYTIDTVTLQPSSSLTDLGGGNYRFQMPDEAVEIVVTTTLKVSTVDKSALGSLLTVADSKQQLAYTPESWATFVTAKTSARGIYGNQTATQGEVDSAVDNLTAQIQALVEKTDPPVVDPPVVDPPVVDPPVVDPPVVDPPVVDPPVVDPPVVDPPVVDPPVVDPPVVDPPVVDPPVVDPPVTPPSVVIVPPSDRGSSRSPGTSTPDYSPNLPQNKAATAETPVSSAEAKTAFNKAVETLPENSTKIVVKISGKATVTKEVIEALEKQAAAKGLPLQINLDTIVGNKVVTRITITSPLTTPEIATNIEVSKGNFSKDSSFYKKFGDNIFVADFAQQTSFGGNVSVFVKLPDNLLGKPLEFYRYNPATKLYVAEAIVYKVDANGYVSFETNNSENLLVCAK